MKVLKVFALLVLVLMTLLRGSIASSPLLQEDEEELGDDDRDDGGDDDFVLEASDHDSPARFLLGRKINHGLTCNKSPRICLLSGGPRRHCCRNKCVNLLGDRRNCGKCGKKCKYSYICCRGKCVNPSMDKKHCGGCNKGCLNGGFCAFGLCNYA